MTYAALFFGLGGDCAGHGLQSQRADDTRDGENRLGDVEPVVVVGLHHLCADGLVRYGRGFGSDGVALAPVRVSRHHREKKKF